MTASNVSYLLDTLPSFTNHHHLHIDKNLSHQYDNQFNATWNILKLNETENEGVGWNFTIDNSTILSDTSWAETFRDSSRFWVQRVLVPIVIIIGVLGNSVTIYILTRRPMRSSTNVNAFMLAKNIENIKLVRSSKKQSHNFIEMVSFELPIVLQCAVGVLDETLIFQLRFRYLTALAVSDLLFLLFSFSMSWRHYPFVNTIWFYWWYTPFGLWMTDASSSTSVWLIVSFTIERYIAVCHPMRGKIFCTEERALRVAIAVYLICFALTASTPFEWRAAIAPNQTSPHNETIYTLESTAFGENTTYRLVYHWFTTVFFVLLPVVILAIFNFFLIHAVRKSRKVRKVMTNQMSSVRQVQIMRQENRITLILIVVVIVFFLSQLPTAFVLIYTSIHVVHLGSVEDNVLRGLGNIFNLLVATNAACNFLLYTALSDKYRKYFCNFFFCRQRKNTRNARQFDGHPFEMDTMDTTLSLTRVSSLRMEYNPGENRRQFGAGGELRRAHTYNYTSGRFAHNHPNRLRPNVDHFASGNIQKGNSHL
ncbi:FMRFamide receptor, partial [Orchesella cincta]